MAIKILERLYSEIYTDGETDWLLANVGEWQKLKLKCEVAIDLMASQQSPIQIDYINNAFVLSTGESWGGYGFDDGMIFILRYKKSTDTTNDGDFDTVSSTQKSYTITNIYGSTMEVQETIEVDGFDSIPINFGSKKISEVLFYVSALPEGCRITYGHIVNDEFENKSLNSFIDATETEFAFSGLNNLGLGNWGTMEPIGLQSGMSIRDVKIRRVEDFGSDDALFLDYTVNNIEFTITPETISGEDNDFDYTVLPISTTNTGDYKTITNPTDLSLSPSGIPSVNSSDCFLYDASSDYFQDLLFDLFFRIVGTNETDDNDVVSVCLLRFSGGSNLVFAEEINVQSWIDARGNLGKQIFLNKIQRIDVNLGDSFCIVYKYKAPLGDYVDLSIEGGNIHLSKKDVSFPIDGRLFYEFELQYMISSFFEDLNNLEENEIPSYLTGDGSLTDNFRIKFYPEWNNPNVLIQNDMSKTRRLGNTGWFNENYNELTNDFQVDSVKYFDVNGNPVDSLDYSTQTKVQIIISGVSNLGVNTECGFGFAWIPTDELDYKEKESPFYRNCFVQSGSLENGFSLDQLYTDEYIGAGVDGGSMDTTKIKFTKSGNKIVFEADFIPNGAFFNIFESKDEDDRNFAIWVSVADGTLVRNFSDRVALLADVGLMVKNIPPAGSYSGIDNTFIEHPFDETNTGETILQGIVQDDILCRMPLRIPTDGSKDFQRITFGVEAFNIGLNESFELEKLEIDLTQFPITSDGVKQIAVDTVRGFKLQPGNNKNWVKIERETSLDINGFAGFLCYFATKIRWEDWIQRNGVPSAFFDANELNDGSNNDWIGYLRTQGWTIKYFSEIISNESGGLLEYKNRWDMDFVDYDENENVSVTHQYFRDSDNTLLNVGTDPENGRPLGVIISNERTRIEIEFEILDTGTWDVSTTYGVTTIEIDRGSGRFEQRQLSSVWESENDNPLKPLDGETKLKLEVDGTNKFLKMSCLVDPDLLEDANKYRITGRVGCMDDGGTEFTPGLYEFRYEETYE